MKVLRAIEPNLLQDPWSRLTKIWSRGDPSSFREELPFLNHPFSLKDSLVASQSGVYSSNWPSDSILTCIRHGRG